MCRHIFGNSRLLIHTYYSTKPRLTPKLWINSTAELYPGTMPHHEYQVLLNPILSPTALGNYCAIIYFAKHPPGTPDLGSLQTLRALVNYAQPGYAVTVYGTTTPALETSRCREYHTASYFDDHPCIHLRFYTDSAGSHEMGDWNCMLLTSTTFLLPPQGGYYCQAQL